MPQVSANGVDIYYERGEPGSIPLLFISGSGGDLRNKPNQLDSPLAKRFSLLAYDQRGLGQTSKPSDEYSMADYADDAAALLDALGIDQIALIGVSFGGMVAQELMLRHPHKVSMAVLACTSAGGEGGASYPLHEIHDLPTTQRAQTHLKVADLRHTDEWINTHPDKWQKRVELAVKGRALSETSAAREGAWKQLQARKEHDTFDRLKQINIPVLCTGGRYDGVAPESNMRAIHGEISNSEIEFFTGGHMFLIQDKAAYPYIIQWLERHM